MVVTLVEQIKWTEFPIPENGDAQKIYYANPGATVAILYRISNIGGRPVAIISEGVNGGNAFPLLAGETIDVVVTNDVTITGGGAIHFAIIAFLS